MIDKLLKVDSNKDNLVDQIQDLQERLDNLERFALTEEIMSAENYGYINSAWQKDPLRLGYSGDKSELKSNTNADAGTNTLSGSAVPAGEIWVVEAAACANVDKGTIRLQIGAIVNGVEVYLQDFVTSSVAEFAVWSGAITLSEDDYIRGTFHSCDAGDDIYLQYHARRIDIDQ